MKFRYDIEKEELVVYESSRIEYHQMQLWLTRHVKGWRFHPAVKMGVWDGKKTYFRNGRINLGLWREALKGCKEIEVPFNIENKEDFPINRNVTLEKVQEFCSEFFKNHKVKTKEGFKELLLSGELAKKGGVFGQFDAVSSTLIGQAKTFFALLKEQFADFGQQFLEPAKVAMQKIFKIIKF